MIFVACSFFGFSLSSFSYCILSFYFFYLKPLLTVLVVNRTATSYWCWNFISAKFQQCHYFAHANFTQSKNFTSAIISHVEIHLMMHRWSHFVLMIELDVCKNPHSDVPIHDYSLAYSRLIAPVPSSPLLSNLPPITLYSAFATCKRFSFWNTTLYRYATTTTKLQPCITKLLLIVSVVNHIATPYWWWKFIFAKFHQCRYFTRVGFRPANQILRICTKTKDSDRSSQEWRRASGRPPTT